MTLADYKACGTVIGGTIVAYTFPYIHICMYACMYEHKCPHVNGHSLSYLFMHPQFYVCARARICMLTVHDMHTEVVHVLQIVYNCMIDIILAFSCALAEMICSCTLCETYGYNHSTNNDKHNKSI